jgi:hypothetical protein
VAVERGEEWVWVSWLVGQKRGGEQRRWRGRRGAYWFAGLLGGIVYSSDECGCGQVWLRMRPRDSLASQVSLMMMLDLAT